MNKFSMLIRTFRERLFGGVQEQPAIDTAPSMPENVRERFPEEPGRLPVEHVEPSRSKGAAKQSSVQPEPASRRQPYFIQIGFDYGTSYSKCVCRDVMTDRAWVHIPKNSSGNDLPFLIPSALSFIDGKLGHVEKPDIHYPKGGIYHLKHALVKVALGQLGGPVLDPFRHASKESEACQLRRFVLSCAVYFLAGALGGVREQVRQRMPGFGEHAKDYMAVNLAVPISDAERPDVNELYHGVLCEAWGLADQLSGYPPMELKGLESLRERNPPPEDHSVRDACFIYPEVSANVQGFVRSRASSPGMYLFSDTGAATVDQSVFIFLRRQDNTDHLAYLHGNVLPCGSGQIEFQAAKVSGMVEPKTLEIWRARKEADGTEHELVVAKNNIAEQLVKGTRATLACAKSKLYRRDQINEIRLIFGGGGHCDNPYKISVVKPFSGDLFRKAIRPPEVGLPAPVDLDLDYTQRRWMSRLAVAYGLSFYRSDLAPFTYPRDVEPPEPDQLWPRRVDLPEAPTKDQC
jgi:hypothetical protein